MRKNIGKGFALGVVCGILILALVGTAFATVGTKTATLLYENLKITLDGEQLTPKDVNGNIVEPFTIDGTTYLPLRAIAEMLGLNVEWDGENKTAVLTTGESVASGTVLVDQNGIKITYTGISKDNYSTDVKLLIENNSNQPVLVQIRDESINGFMTSGIFSCAVEPGKKANDGISFYHSTLEENGITSISQIELKFNVMNGDTWRTIFETGAITINP